MKQKILITTLVLSIVSSMMAFANPTTEPEGKRLTEQETTLQEETPLIETVEESSEPYPSMEIGNKNESGGELVWIDEGRHVFYYSEFGIYSDEDGTLSESELIALGIKEHAELESLAKAREVTVSLTTVFNHLSPEEKKEIPQVLVEVSGQLRYVDEEDVTTEFGTIVLEDKNEFKASYTFSCSDHIFSLTPKIPTDYFYTYEISAESEGKPCYSLSSENASYDVIITISKTENAKVENQETTLAEEWDKMLDGSYSESRAKELNLKETEGETEIEAETDTERDKEFPILPAACMLSSILFIFGIIYYLRYKANKDEL